MVQKRSNPLKDDALPDRFSRLIIKHMIRLSLSDDQLLSRLKVTAGITRGSLASIRRHKDGSGGIPTTQTIGGYQKALDIPAIEIDELLYPGTDAVIGRPGLPVLRDQFAELVAELKRQSNMPYEVQLARAAARAALEEEKFEEARTHLIFAADVTRQTAEHAADEYARSLASLGALALTEMDFDEAQLQFGRALVLPGLSSERARRYQRSYLIASTAIIARSETLTEARRVMEEIIDKAVQPDQLAFNAIMSKADDYDAAAAVLTEMQGYAVTPSVWTFNILMSKSRNYEQATAVFDILERSGVTPDEVSFRTMMSKAKNYGQATASLKKMRESEFTADVRTFNTLLSKAESYDQAATVREEMRGAGVTADVWTFNTLMAKADTFDEAAAVLQNMRDAGFAPDVWSFNALISKAHVYEQAASVLSEMRGGKITPDRVTFTTLLSKTEDRGQAATVMMAMREANLAPDTRVFNALLARTTSYAEASALLIEMQGNVIAADVWTFNTIISKTESYDQAAAVIKEMQEAGVAPDVVTFITLMSRVATRSNAEHGVSAWQSWRQFPNQVFGTLVKVLAETHSAEELFDVCFGAASMHSIKFPTTAFQDGIARYVKQGRLDDALRVAVAFPHLPGSLKLFSSFPTNAEAFFRKHFHSEPNHASYALARLFEATGQVEKMVEWASIALHQDRQPSSRLSDIERMLSTGRQPFGTSRENRRL